jgi:hypothetical protein
MSITTTTGVDNNVILLFVSPRRYGHEFRILSEHFLIGVATSISIVVIPPWYNDHCIAVIVGVIAITIVIIISITATNNTT